MNASKTEFLNMRVSPQTKQTLRLIAEREKRSMVNTLEWLIADYAAKTEIAMSHTPHLPSRAHADIGEAR